MKEKKTKCSQNEYFLQGIATILLNLVLKTLGFEQRISRDKAVGYIKSSNYDIQFKSMDGLGSSPKVYCRRAHFQ